MAAIREGVPAAESFRRFARKNLRRLSRDLDKARGNGQGIVHDVRKRLKLLRSLTRLLRPALGKRLFEEDEQDLRQAHHLLAEARQAGAMVETVEKLVRFAREGRLTAEFEPLKEAVARSQAAIESAGATAEAIDEAKARAAAVIRRLAQWRLPNRHVGLFVEGLRMSYARARRDLAAGFAACSIELLHEGRKSVIHLRYQIDMIAPLWPSLFRLWCSELQHLRELLGDMSDLEALEKELENPAGALSSAAGEDVRRVVTARRAALLAEAKPLSARLFAEKPSAFEERMVAIWLSYLKSPPRPKRALTVTSA